MKFLIKNLFVVWSAIFTLGLCAAAPASNVQLPPVKANVEKPKEQRAEPREIKREDMRPAEASFSPRQSNGVRPELKQDNPAKKELERARAVQTESITRAQDQMRRTNAGKSESENRARIGVEANNRVSNERATQQRGRAETTSLEKDSTSRGAAAGREKSNSTISSEGQRSCNLSEARRGAATSESSKGGASESKRGAFVENKTSAKEVEKNGTQSSLSETNRGGSNEARKSSGSRSELTQERASQKADAIKESSETQQREKQASEKKLEQDKSATRESAADRNKRNISESKESSQNKVNETREKQNQEDASRKSAKLSEEKRAASFENVEKSKRQEEQAREKKVAQEKLTERVTKAEQKVAADRDKKSQPEENKSTLAREQSASNSSAENRRSRVTMNDLVKERRASAERFASVETQDKGTTEKTPKDTARLADGLRERQEGHTQAHSTLVHTNVTGHATGKDVINASSREKESTTEKAGGKIRWGFWDDYAKVTVEGREYAQVGDRLFTRHAVDRMTPSGLGTAAGGAKGRSVSPNFIEDVLTSPKSSRISMKGPDGEARVSHQLGTLQVITENDIVITVITH